MIQLLKWQQERYQWNNVITVVWLYSIKMISETFEQVF